MVSVCIAGAGPTGLTAALELARNGAQVIVLERRAGASNLSRAVGIQQASLNIFEPTKVADAIRAEAICFEGVIFHDTDRPIARLPLNFDDRSRIWGLAQDRTEHHICTALAGHGVAPTYGCEVTGFEQDADCVRVHHTNGTLRADYLIGCDGVGSAVRQAMGLLYDGFDLPGDWSIADVDATDWPNPKWFQGFLLPDGHICVVVPLEAARFRVIASHPDALKALPVPMQVSNIRRSGTFTISVRQVSQYQQGRVFLAGDAAHCHSPVGGRGMNLGIADAADLAARILAGDTSGYHAARHAAGAHVLSLSERGRRMVMGGPARRMVLKTLMRGLATLPPARRAAMRFFVNG